MKNRMMQQIKLSYGRRISLAWTYLVIASLGEILGMMSINLYLQKRTIQRLLLIVVTFSFGFIFLSLAMRGISLGTAYAVWTGLGAAVAVLMGILFFNESANWKRIVFLCCIIAGAVALNLLEYTQSFANSIEPFDCIILFNTTTFLLA